MEMISADILGDVRQLSTVFSVLALLAGGILWLAGWTTHRFWVVLALTIGGGIIGLQHAAELRTTPLLAAIGVGLAAGLLALTVVRLGAFVAGGFAMLVVAHAWMPSFDQPMATFLTGGLVGWFLFRYWTMALTSLAGSQLVLYGGLALADRLGRLDSVAWAEANAGKLNGVAMALVAMGFAVQFGVAWFTGGAADERSEGKKDKKEDKKSKGGTLLSIGLAAFRRAG